MYGFYFFILFLIICETIFSAPVNVTSSKLSANTTLALNESKVSTMPTQQYRTRTCRRYKSLQTMYAKTVPEVKRMYSSSVVGACHRSVDWTKEMIDRNGNYSPAVTHARDQGPSCGACWAIAAVSAIEVIARLKAPRLEYLENLSVQEILDCSDGFGCIGGTEIQAYSYIIGNEGLATEARYPYRGTFGKCDTELSERYTPELVGMIGLVYPRTEAELKRILCHTPVTAAIPSNSLEFQSYKGGIFTGECGDTIDLTVLVLGYDEEDGVEYWIVQNSWGDRWGEDGYIYMSFESGLKCGIFKEASYPYIYPDIGDPDF